MSDEHSYEIEINNVTKKYSETVGVFDINIKIKKGEIYGFIGPNGAGKSTTIRQMVGFINLTKEILLSIIKMLEMNPKKLWVSLVICLVKISFQTIWKLLII
ncbi:ATP-binding cassette domain-containing protein [Spiroplasma endosymbiont of Virgichneumon dumeticola]|uniref:ATP-binding cassette domain-containing protein n=1 Tax=Spiroplasma endosymbiont of Virgichneumon dumeticola TaxID=3139323 RepID=UPI0035C8E510